MQELAFRARPVQFGPFALDVRSGELRNGSTRLKVPSQSIEILKALLEQPGELVTRDQLRARLWPADTFVDFEHGLNAAIRRLREALGDSADTPAYIETLPRRGYRFVGPIEATADPLVTGAAPASLVDAAAARRHRPAWPVLLLAGSLALAVGAGIWIGRHRSATTAPRQSPVTSFPGREADPAISPAGDYVAFAWDGDRGGNLDIYVKLIDGGEPVQLTSGSTDERAPAWSPDGSRIAFLRILDPGHAVVAIIPPSGGPERRLESTLTTGNYWATQAIAWAPDGRSVLFAGTSDSAPSAAIFAASIDTDTRLQLTTPSADFSDAVPRISPDGRQLGFIRRVAGAWVGYPSVQPLDGLRPAGAARRLTDDQRASSFDWFPDGRSIVYDRGRETLWRVPADGGSPQPLLGSEVRGCRPAFARDGARLLYQRLTLDTNIWRVSGLSRESVEEAQPPVRLIASTFEDGEAQYSPDGERIAFVSSRSGQGEIWVSASDGTHPMKITNGSLVGSPRWSPDGRWIAFDSLRSGSFNIYVVSSQGGSERTLTAESSNNVRPSWSNDGRWIYFGSNRSGNWQIWKIPAPGGTQVPVTRGGGFEAFESPDGRSLYFAGPPNTAGIWRVPVSGGEEVRVVDHGEQGYVAVADRGLFLVNVEAKPTPTIESLDFLTGRLSKVASLTPGTRLISGALGFHVSRDGRWFIYVNRDALGSDIAMLEGVK